MIDSYAYVGDDAMGGYVARQLREYGWERADGVSEADAVLTYFSSQSALEDAYFDVGGLIANAMSGAFLIDLSPSTPALSREISAVAVVNDLHPVEAPLAVNDPLCKEAFASSGNLTCFAAGEEDDVEEARDLLRCLAASVLETGPSGSSQVAKAAHTVQAAARVVAAIEAEAMHRSLGVEAMGPERSGRDDGAGMDASARRVAEAAVSGDFTGDFTLAMLLGDVAAAMAAADDVNLIVPHLEASCHLMELLALVGGAEKGATALSLLYREEEASAAQGLDWTRAEGLYGEGAHAHHRAVEGDGPDGEGGFAGGLGGFSAN